MECSVALVCDNSRTLDPVHVAPQCNKLGIDGWRTSSPNYNYHLAILIFHLFSKHFNHFWLIGFHV